MSLCPCVLWFGPALLELTRLRVDSPGAGQGNGGGPFGSNQRRDSRGRPRSRGGSSTSCGDPCGQATAMPDAVPDAIPDDSGLFNVSRGEPRRLRPPHVGSVRGERAEGLPDVLVAAGVGYPIRAAQPEPNTRVGPVRPLGTGRPTHSRQERSMELPFSRRSHPTIRPSDIVVT